MKCTQVPFSPYACTTKDASNRLHFNQICTLFFLYFWCQLRGPIAAFPIAVNIVQTPHGFKRIQFNGFAFGCRRSEENQQRKTWSCTGSGPQRKRCMAKIETILIEGCIKMRIKNDAHICVSQDYHQSGQRLWLFMRKMPMLNGTVHAKNGSTPCRATK